VYKNIASTNIVYMAVYPNQCYAEKESSVEYR